jgi:queuosine precursor transporter
MTTNRDRWLLPNRQREYPSRRVLSEEHLHARREATFLVLAGTFLVAAATLPVLGMSRIIDLSSVAPDVELPFALLLPVGVLAYPLSFSASNLVCELWGRRRASALVWVGTLLGLGLVGLLAVTDSIPDPAGQTADSVAPALGFVACFFVGQMFNVQAYQALRRQSRGRHLWLRRNVAALISSIAGWIIFALVMYTWAVQIAEQPSEQAAKQVGAFAFASGLYCMAFAIADTVPLAVIARALQIFLRLGRLDSERDTYADGPTAGLTDSSPRLPAALVVDGGGTKPPPPPAGRGRISKGFNTVERRFFTEGEELENAEAQAAGDSFNDMTARGGQSA